MDTVIYIAASERPLDRQMLAGVKSFAKNTGWNVQSVPDVRAKAQIAKLINMWNPLGLIVLCTTDTQPLSLFAGKPVVIIGRRQRKNESGVHYVHYDAANISELAAKELLSLQLKEYAFVTSKVPTMWSDTRLSSFKALMKLHGKVVKVFDSSQFLESEAELASSLAEWLKRLRAPAGVFAANDDIAVLVENSCQLAGLSVPDDVIGFTRYQPWFSALGCLAVALVAERIDAKAGSRLMRVLSGFILAGLILSALLAAYRRYPRIEYKAIERRTVHPLVRTGFWAGPTEFRKRFAPFVRNFVPRYNYLTCKENYCRILMKELGRDGVTVIEPADGIARLLGLDRDWDERSWVPGFSGFDHPTESNEDSARKNDSEPAESPSTETSNRTWTDAPFGYWVLVSPETAHFAEYYRRTEPDDSARGGIPVKDVLHAWFVTYPKEVKVGEKVKIDTRTGEYLGRANG